jgi:tripartite-type tricarboxylate transporter receptor subunit TctC
MMGSLPFALLVPAAAPYRTVGDLVAQAKARPGMMNFASTGIGGLSHLLSGWFAAEAGISANHIPYAGSAPALSAMLGGQVDFYFDPVANSAALVKSGKLRALATTSERRSPVIPSAPTLIESGYPVRGEVWLGWMVAGATPAPIVSRLNREINAVLNEPEVRLQLEAKGLTVTPMSPQAFGAFTASEIKTWTRLARDNGIKPG